MDWELDETQNVDDLSDRENGVNLEKIGWNINSVSSFHFDASSNSETLSETDNGSVSIPTTKRNNLQESENESSTCTQLSQRDCDEGYHVDETSLDEENEDGGDYEENMEELDDFNDEQIAQLERDVLALCNGLRPLSIENSGGSQPFHNTVLILTKETLLNLHDIDTLLRQNSSLDSNGERSFCVEALLLNPKYKLLESSLVPVWIACLDTEQEAEYLGLLIFIFARVLIPPNKTWKYRNIPSRVRWYLEAYTRIRGLFYKPFFWKGFNHAMHRLFIELKNNDLPTSQNEERCKLFKQKEELIQSGLDDATFSQKLREINENLHRLDTHRLKRNETFNVQLMSLKTLLLCVMRLAAPSDPQYSLTISTYIAKHALWDLFEAEWRDLLSSESLARHNRPSGMTIVLWRILDFYGRLLYEIPPVELLRNSSLNHNSSSDHFLPSLPLPHKSPPSLMTPIFLRHTRFNPELMRHRLQQVHGQYTSLVQRDTLPRATPLRRRVLERSEAFSCSLYPDIYDLCLRPLNLPSPLHNVIRSSSGLLSDDIKVQFVTHLDSFVRVGLNTCIRAWMADCTAEDELLDEYDLFKLMNFMSWILHYERCWIQAQLEKLKHCAENSEDKSDQAILKDIVAHALSLRAILESDGILFVYKSFHTCLRKSRLANKTDFLVKLCLRTLVEQLHFGLALTQECFSSSAEALNVVGRCVIEDVFRCNLCNDITWILRFINPSVHEMDLLYYTFETTLLLIHVRILCAKAMQLSDLVQCFRKLGGSAAVAFGRSKRRFQPGSLTRITRRVEATEFMEQLADGRILRTMMKCLQRYRVHEGHINKCLAKLLLCILVREKEKKIEFNRKQNQRDHQRPHVNHVVGLCFQLSYFDLFLKILQDTPFKRLKESQSLIQCIQWIVEQFWSVFEHNKFVVVELLFSKYAKSPTIPFSYADPNVLLSVFTNYEKGLDRDYLDAISQQNNDREALSEWRRQNEAQRRAEKHAWTPHETRHVLRLWEMNKNLPHALRLIRRSTKSKRTLREIHSHLVDLGILELEPHSCLQQTQENFQANELALLRAVLTYCLTDLNSSLNQQSPAEQSPKGCLLSQLQKQLMEFVERRRSQQSSCQDFPIQIDDDAESHDQKSSEFSNLMEALGAVRDDTGYSCRSFKSTPLPCHWYIPGSIQVNDLQRRVEKLGSYLHLSEDDLRYLLCHGERTVSASTRLFEQLSKMKIITSLALIKRFETVFDWSDTDELCTEVSEILKNYDQIRVSWLGVQAQWNSNLLRKEHLLEYFTANEPLEEFKCLALPETISSSSLAQALAAGLDHLARKRKHYILHHASPIPNSERFPLGQLVFPEQSLNTSFQYIIDFIKNSAHPLLAHLLQSLGFQPHLQEDRSTIWILPLHRSLQRIEADLNHLRSYAMSTFSLLTNTLKHLASGVAKTVSQSEGEKRLRECPTLIVEHLDNQACHYMAKAIYKLRLRSSQAGLNTYISAEFQRIMSLVQQWNKQRPENGSSHEDSDFFISMGSEFYENETEHEHHIGRLNDMLEFQQCLISILGRCDINVTPHEWFWSKGCSRQIIDAYLSHATFCLTAPLKSLKRYAKRKILFDEFVTFLRDHETEKISVTGSDGRADISQYKIPSSSLSGLLTRPLDTNHYEQLNSHDILTTSDSKNDWQLNAPYAIDSTLINPLDNEEFFTELLREASEDYQKYINQSPRTRKENLQESLDSFSQKIHKSNVL